MPVELAVHVFDDALAEEFSASATFVKTAIRVDPAAPDGVTRIQTRFGEQSFVGPFFLVAEADGSYGVALEEFETTHDRVGDSLWVKRGSVRAYPLAEECVVETRIGTHLEASTRAVPGDWIVKQPSGELVVMPEPEFRRRYV